MIDTKTIIIIILLVAIVGIVVAIGYNNSVKSYEDSINQAYQNGTYDAIVTTLNTILTEITNNGIAYLNYGNFTVVCGLPVEDIS